MNRPDLIESVARAIASALGMGIVEVACLAALVFILARLSRPSATTRHVLWWIALSAGATLPIVSIAMSLGRIEHRAPAPVRDRWVAPAGVTGAVPHSTARVWSAAQMAAATRSQNPSSPPALEQPLARAGALAASVAALPHVAAAIVALWFIVALAGLGALTRSLLALAAIKRAALPLDEAVVRRLRRWRHSTRLGRSVALRVSSDVDVPVAVGFRTPTILLPLRVVETEEIADLDQIAMHEYAHLDRYDDWTNLGQRVLERIFWFNPIVLLVGRQISLEREIACDDWVVAQTGRAHRYATCLWKLVESARLPAKPIVAPGALLTPKQITTRIEQLLDSRRNALPRLSPLGAIALGTLGVALVVLQAQRAPVIAVEDVPAPVAPVAAASPAPAVGPRAALSPLAVKAPAGMPSTARPAAPAAPAVHAQPATHAAPAVPAALPNPALPPVMAHVAVHATPDAVSREVAAALAHRNHTLLKATIEKAIHEHIASSVASAAQRAAVEAEAEAEAGAEAGAAAGAAGAQIGAAMSEKFATELSRTVAENWAADREPETLTRDVIAKCFGCDLHGRDLRGLDLHGISLNGVDLRGADLSGVDLSHSKLFGVDLRNAKLDGANLSAASLNGCDMRGTSLAKVNFEGLHLMGTSIRGVTLGSSRLRSLIDKCMGCDLRGIDLRGQDLGGIELFGADLRGADLRGANLRGAKLTGVNLSDARFEGADLTNASLTGCELRRTDLNAAKTQGLSTVYTDFHGFEQHLSRLDDSLSKLSKVSFLSRRTCSLHRAMAP